MGQYAEAEARSAAGRADAVVKTGDRVYVFEFKLAPGGTVEGALEQIGEKGYLIPWTATGKKLVLGGAVFDQGKMLCILLFLSGCCLKTEVSKQLYFFLKPLFTVSAEVLSDTSPLV
jgi:hypothetical protein